MKTKRQIDIIKKTRQKDIIKKKKRQKNIKKAIRLGYESPCTTWEL